MGLRISLLGEQHISDAATGATLSHSSRAIALVACLVLHAGMPQSRQVIAGMFWPDSTDAQALTNLRRELHTLRRVIGDAPNLEVTARDLCWRDGEETVVDLRVFEVESRAALAAAERRDHPAALRHADAALAQYKGELLPGSYDDWLLDARTELQHRCADLCDLVSDLRARRGELPEALEAARRRIRLEPLEEAGYRTLMELQAEAGDRAGAVSTYHRCASILERELGVVPDESTRATLQRIMTHQRATDLPRQPTAPVEPDASRSGIAATPLIGRAGEVGLLDAAWRSATAGRAGVAVVRGGAGVGKTRLVTDVARSARQDGAVVAVSQCFGTSGRLALTPVADWLRNPAVASAGGSLEPVWREEVERLVPSGQAREEPPAGSGGMVDAWLRHRFFEGLARALLATGRPMLLVLDNMQWCDQETLAFLAFLLGLSPQSPLLVAATLRTDSPNDEPEIADWITRMRTGDLLTELTLHPLELADTARLAEAMSGRPFTEEDRSLLQAATGGFPLHVVEAMRAVPQLGAAPLPASDLTAVLRGRLEQASTTARDVAGLAAAVGRDFSLDLLVEAGDQDADSVVEAVDELWRRRIVQEQGDAYDFSHDLLRDAAYAQVSPPKRWLLHRRLAQALELLHADNTDPVSAQLAEQYARGGRPERAVTYYLRAAEVASSVFAHAEATRLHSEALSIVRARPPGRESDRQELAILEAMAAPLNARHGYASTELQAVLERSTELAESLGRRDSLLSALVGLWACRFVQGRVDDAHQGASRALALVEPDSELTGAAHFALGGSAVSLGMPAEGLRHLEIAASFPGPMVSVGTRPDVHGRAFAAHAHWLLGHDDLALARCQEAVSIARSIDHPYSLAVALAYAGITHQMRGDRAGLRSTVSELRELCDRYGFGYYREWTLVLEGWHRGDEQGVELARRGIANLRSEGSFTRMPYWLALLADVLDRTGRRDDARSTLDAAASGARARSDVWWLPDVERMRAGYDDREDVAVSRLRGAAELAAAHGSLALLRRCERDLAERGAAEHVTSVRPPS